MHDFITYDVDFNEQPVGVVRPGFGARVKGVVRSTLLRKLHGVDMHRLDRVETIASVGVKGIAEFDFETHKRELLNYERSLNCGDFAYKFAKSCASPVLYGSVYAAMLEGLLGALDMRSENEKRDWADFINSFQKEDGLYCDPLLAGPAFEHVGIWNEGWGKKHLLGHVIIALARLGAVPKHPFRFLEPFYDADYLTRWMDGFEFRRNVWTDSNFFMNLYTALQYSRDWMNDSHAGKAVAVMADWLLKHQNPDSGMWHALPMKDLSERGRLYAIRGAYHFYPLFEYDRIEVPHREKIIDFVLNEQSRFGAFDRDSGNPGACEDIDAAEPLIRFSSETGYRTAEVKAALRRLLVWSFSARCSDGGFSFYVRSSHEYASHPLMSSGKGESSLFATWFRTLMHAYAMRFCYNLSSFEIGSFPGYEIK